MPPYSQHPMVEERQDNYGNISIQKRRIPSTEQSPLSKTSEILLDKCKFALF